MLTDMVIVGRLLLAAILGGLIGLERELLKRAAGLRTHILVAVGSALFMLISFQVATVWIGANADPGRIAAQVVTGIGFLGAGTIIRDRAAVRGLTTAASIWTVSAIGMAVGIGFYTAAITTTVVVLVTLFVFSQVERKFTKRN